MGRRGANNRRWTSCSVGAQSWYLWGSFSLARALPWSWVPHWGWLGTGVCCAEWVLEYRVELELFCGIPAADKEAESGQPHWEDSDCSWMDEPGRFDCIFCVPEQTKGEQHRQGWAISLLEREEDLLLSFLLPLPKKASSKISGNQFHNLGASWVPGPGQMLRSSVVTSYQVLGTTLYTKE